MRAIAGPEDTGLIDVKRPCPTILSHGRPKTHSARLLPGAIGAGDAPTPGKPPYRVPSMAEIAVLPWNGLTVVSTFSGCGGSCLGYRMAGFRVLWASEFVPAAADVYRRNHPGSVLDTRDIRSVKPEEVLAAAGKAPGEIDLLEGSPPCASFSTAGKRARHWGAVRPYSDTRQRTDDLFFEFVRLLRGIRPRAFVAENVSGLVKGVAKGYFLEILAALKGAGYVVEARLLDAQWLGVPQMRQRIFFQGVRADLGKAPAWPRPLPYRYSVRDVLTSAVSVPCLVSGKKRARKSTDGHGPSVGADSIGGCGPAFAGEVEVQIAPVAAFRDRRGAFGKDGEISDSPAPAVLAETAGNLWIEGGNVCAVEWQGADGPAPTIRGGRPLRVATGAEPPCGWKAEDRRARRDAASDPSPTVLRHGTGFNGIVVEGVVERRKFTIAELKRICAFPDDFVLTGTYAQQWERLGRAVPPLMMYHVARAIRDGPLCQSNPPPGQ
jgi:DNA (cytosine-5)-methyltransferase 1